MVKATHRSPGRRTLSAARVRAMVSPMVRSRPCLVPAFPGGHGPEPVVVLTEPVLRSDTTVDAEDMTAAATQIATTARRPARDRRSDSWPAGAGPFIISDPVEPSNAAPMARRMLNGT